jgi:hypothetical protein
MTAIELVKEYFPAVTDRQANMILWEYTGFPEFFDGPGTVEECLRRQLQELRDTTNLETVPEA